MKRPKVKTPIWIHKAKKSPKFGPNKNPRKFEFFKDVQKNLKFAEVLLLVYPTTPDPVQKFHGFCRITVSLKTTQTLNPSNPIEVFKIMILISKSYQTVSTRLDLTLVDVVWSSVFPSTSFNPSFSSLPACDLPLWRWQHLHLMPPAGWDVPQTVGVCVTRDYLEIREVDTSQDNRYIIYLFIYYYITLVLKASILLVRCRQFSMSLSFTQSAIKYLRRSIHMFAIVLTTALGGSLIPFMIQSWCPWKMSFS